MEKNGNSKLFTVGLTGGIASGKTLVSDLFASLDVPVVDSDVIAREMVAMGSVGLAAITAHFGEQVLDTNGELDRAKMRQLIFSDQSRKLQLENILHPLIMTESKRRIERMVALYAIFVVPLLVDKNLQSTVDRVLLVDTSEDTQIKRLMARDSCSAIQAQSILNNQSSRTQRLKVADDVISNDTDTASVKDQVLVLHEKYRIMGRSKSR